VSIWVLLLLGGSAELHTLREIYVDGQSVSDDSADGFAVINPVALRTIIPVIRQLTLAPGMHTVSASVKTDLSGGVT
jgi:hypothetical protein